MTKLIINREFYHVQENIVIISYYGMLLMIIEEKWNITLIHKVTLMNIQQIVLSMYVMLNPVQRAHRYGIIMAKL